MAQKTSRRAETRSLLIRVDCGLADFMSRLAEQEGVSRNELINQVFVELEAWCGDGRFRSSRKNLKCLAKAAGFETSKDVKRAERALRVAILRDRGALHV